MTAFSAKTLAPMAAVLLVSLVSLPAHAETDEQRAVTLFDKGRKLARDGRCQEAIPVLFESVRFAEGVGPLLNLGNCYETLGKSASAHRWFLRAQEVAASRDDLKRRDEAAGRAKAIEKDIPTLVLHIPASLGMTTEVHVDGETWPRDRWETAVPIDPGMHEIEILTASHPKQMAQVSLRAKGDRLEWTASVPALPKGPAPTSSLAARMAFPPTRDPEREDTWKASSAPQSSTSRTLGVVAGGVGIAGLATGAIFGVISLSAHASLVGRCPTYPRCDVADRPNLQSVNGTAESTGTVATIAVISGAVLLVSGLALYFASPTSRSPR